MNKLDSELGNRIEIYLFDESGRCVYYYNINNKSEVGKDGNLLTGFIKAIMSFSANFNFSSIKDTVRIIKGDCEIRIPYSDMVYGALKISGRETLDEKALDKTDELLRGIVGRLMLDHSSDLTKFITSGNNEGLREINSSIEQAIVKNKITIYTDYLKQILIEGINYGFDHEQLSNVLRDLNEEYNKFINNYKNAVLKSSNRIMDELNIIKIFGIMQSFNDSVKELLSRKVRLAGIINKVNTDSAIWRLFNVPLIR